MLETDHGEAGHKREGRKRIEREDMRIERGGEDCKKRKWLRRIMAKLATREREGKE